MAKISPVSIKYMVHINFTVEGALEKPDVIGAIFGQTEGLLGADLEMRELQKDGKIGRIEVELERRDKKTIGKIFIPTALDQSETTLIAAAVETIERIGPCDSHLEVEKIEDVRGTKRDYIVERAKRLMKEIEGATDSKEISNTIKDSAKVFDVQTYGDEKLPCGDLSGNEVIVVEGRADVMNLLRNDVKNVIAMNGTKLPDAIKELGEKKELTLFVDGDRGGKLITQNVLDNAKVAYITSAPDGKEVEELVRKEILIALRKRVSINEYVSSGSNGGRRASYSASKESASKEESEKISRSSDLTEEEVEKLREYSKKNIGSGKAIILDENLEEMKKVSEKTLSSTLRRMRNNPFALVVDGTINYAMIEAAEEKGCQVIAARNFSTTDTKIKLLSL